MSNHIDKIATALDAATEKALDTHGKFSTVEMAQSAFNALMDSVTDLVWSVPKYHKKIFGHASAGISIKAKSIIGKYDIESFDKGGKTRWFLFFEGAEIGEYKNVERAKAKADSHHRKQVRKIWEAAT